MSEEGPPHLDQESLWPGNGHVAGLDIPTAARQPSVVLPAIRERGDHDIALDLHCHTAYSYDSHMSPAQVIDAAVRRGLTHIAITDHDVLDGALRTRDQAPPQLTVIVGQEVRCIAGDLIGLYLTRSIAPGLNLIDAVGEIRAQGGLVGLAHPFDRWRKSVASRMKPENRAQLAQMVDYVEAFNCLVRDPLDDALARTYAKEHGLPMVAVSGAHELSQVAGGYTLVSGVATDADSLWAALEGGQRRHFISPAAMRGEPEPERAQPTLFSPVRRLMALGRRSY